MLSQLISTLAVLISITHAVPVAPCPLVLPLDNDNTCISLPPAKLSSLKTEARSNIQELGNVMRTVRVNASSHPNYICLSETQRGSGSGINPQVSNDATELARAVNQIRDCLYPAMLNYSDIENRQRMDGELTHFAGSLLTATDKLTTLAAQLQQLARADNALSPGTLCIIPAATCREANWTNAGQVTAAQSRLRRLVSFSTSIEHYMTDLHSLSYW